MEDSITNEENKYKKLSKLIKKYMQENELEKALELCTEENCINNVIIQKQKITIFLKLNKLEDVIKEAEKAHKRTKNDGFINFKLIAISRQIQILINEKEYERALELCMEENCVNDKVIQSQKNKLSMLKEDQEDIKQVYETVKDNVYIQVKPIIADRIISINDLLTKIYFDDIKLEELNRETLNDWEKLVLTIAFYEKHDKEKAMSFLNSVSLQMNLSMEQKKSLNKLKEKISIKKKTFVDWEIYCNILNCVIDFDYNPEKKGDIMEENIEKESKKIVNVVIKESKKVKKVSPKMITIEGKTKNRHDTFVNESSNHQDENQANNLFIKDIFVKELLEIKKYIYLEMYSLENRRKAIRIWNMLEILEEKKADDKQAYDKAVRIIEIFKNNHSVKDNSRKLVKN